jgi:hypothetical protein
LAGKIYAAIESELNAKVRAKAFTQFCKKTTVRDLESKSLDEVRTRLTDAFTDSDVTLRPNRKEKSLTIEVALPDGHRFADSIEVNPNAPQPGEEESDAATPFVPFPVCLPGDPELVWVLGRQENLAPEEAAIALHRIEEDFWASKTGQKLQRDHVEKCFPEFIARVPSVMLTEGGLKRHYKMPEPLKILRGQAQKR